MNKINKKYKNIINQIEKIRSNNNKYWMNLMRIAMETKPKEASLVLKKINHNDKKISNLVSKLAKAKN